MPSAQDRFAKALADDLARRLIEGGGAAAGLLFARLPPLSAPHGEAPSVRQGTIGIWERGPEGYERAASRRREWPLWANVATIPPKGVRRRVALLGESVARGFLYDPEFNPAQVLESALREIFGQPVEVVDLAKSDLLAPELLDLIDAVPALEPDALVLFAGNNWPESEPRDRLLEATAVRVEGVRGLKELREQRLAAFVEGTLRSRLAELSRRLPVAVVVPEINLADWRLDAEADAPWLSRGANRRWLECRAAARADLAAGRRHSAESMAREMVDLDGGTAASGWTLLADCARAAGDLATARGCLEKARDAHVWDFTHQTPRVLSTVQHGLRGCVSPGRLAVVDLPRCFAAWQDGELPDRRLFMDYCHLSAEGIQVAMAATALEIAALLAPGRPRPALAHLVAESPAPAARDAAAAHFAAALHSAHWGQANAAIAYHCDAAVRTSPETARAMCAYLDIAVRRAPAWACAAVEGLSAGATPFLRGYILRQPGKLFDAVLLETIAGTLEENGFPATAFLEDLRREERALSPRPSDLLDPYFRASWADLDGIAAPGCFRRAYAPVSRFPWVARAARAVSFALTCRRPGTTVASECQVRVNGACVAHLTLTPSWRTHRFEVPAGTVRPGVNWLEIAWPLDPVGTGDAIEEAAHEHELGRLVPLLPAFAEIAALSAVQG